MYSYNNLWERGLVWVTDYGTLIKFSIWHQFMTKYYQYRSICIEINRHDNVVITTTSVTKCIFLNFGAIPKRMVKSIYRKKTKENLKFPPSSSSSSSPTPCSSLLLPLGIWYFLQNILKHTFSKQRNNWNSLRDRLWDTTLRKHSNAFRTPS